MRKELQAAMSFFQRAKILTRIPRMSQITRKIRAIRPLCVTPRWLIALNRDCIIAQSLRMSQSV